MIELTDRFVFKNGKRLRCGFTTGSCAAAAAKGAAIMLLTSKITETAEIKLPDDSRVDFSLYSARIQPDYASCAVIKDGGDDPDTTDGIRIFAKVALTGSEIFITGGDGIGIVTKSGLDQPVGEYAINSVPRKMITESLRDAAAEFGYIGGFTVEISAPEGKFLAAKTYNPRMGIVGGISIIGTTGIVEPMSNSAIVETIRAEAKILRADGEKKLLLAIGNYAETFIREHEEFHHGRAVMCSNFIGAALEIGVELEFESILLVGHLGKLVKLGAGIMNTHSHFADGRMEVLVTCGVIAGVELEILRKIPECMTVDAALEILEQSEKFPEILEILSEKIAFHMNEKVHSKIKTAAVGFSFKNPIILKTAMADELLQEYSNK